MKSRIVLMGVLCALAWGAPRLAAEDAPKAEPAPAATQGAQPAAPGQARARRAQALNGRVAAKAETGFDLQPARRNAAAVKVTTEATTTFARLDRAEAKDVTEGYLVAVYGAREGDKLAARGVLRFAKLEGEPKREDIRSAGAVARAAARTLGQVRRQPGAAPGAAGQQPATTPAPATEGQQPATPATEGQQPAATRAAQRAPAPVLGKVLTAQPLTIETIPLGRDAKAEKLEVQTTEATRYRTYAAITLADVQDGATVLVLPRVGQQQPAAQPAAAVVARAVVVVRAPGAGGRRRQQ